MAGTYSDRVLVGKIVGYFGLQGWVKILSHTEPKDNIFSYKNWWLSNSKLKNNTWQQLKMLKGKKQGKGLVALFDNISDRSGAEQLLGLDIYIESDQLADLPDNDFYWHQLIGLQVMNQDGFDFGQVSDIMATGANDVLVIKREENDPAVLAKNKTGKKGASKKTSVQTKETLIPYIWEQVIKHIDLDKQQILVTWDEDYLSD